MSEPNPDEPLISVVIPTYNRPRYLREAIASALAQTYRNVEVVVSDDASPVDPRPVVEAFNDPRVRYLRNAANLGMFGNTRSAFRAARGKYFASLNDDDALEPDYLTQMIPPLEADPSLVLAFCDTHIIDSAGTIDEPAGDEEMRRWRRDTLREGAITPFYRVALVDRCINIASACVVRAEAVPVGDLPEGAGPQWDVYTAYLACRDGRGAYYTPRRLARYRVHEGSETAVSGSRDNEAKVRKGMALRFCYTEFARDERLREHHGCFRLRAARGGTTAAIGLLRLGRVAEARPLLRESLHTRLSARTAVALGLSYLPGRWAKPLLNPWRGVLRRVPLRAAVRHG